MNEAMAKALYEAWVRAHDSGTPNWDQETQSVRDKFLALADAAEAEILRQRCGPWYGEDREIWARDEIGFYGIRASVVPDPDHTFLIASVHSCGPGRTKEFWPRQYAEAKVWCDTQVKELQAKGTKG